MRLEGILAEAGGNGVFSHAAAEGGGGARRKLGHADGDRGRRHPLADGRIPVFEETVENAAAAAGRLHIDQADDLGGVDLQGARFLRDQHPAAQQGRIIDLVAERLAAELHILGRIGLLTPETVEGRELGVLESDDVGPLVELERRRDRFADHNVAAAQGQAHEDVFRGDLPRGLRLGLRLGLRRRGLPGTARAPVRHDLDPEGARTDLAALDLRGRGRELEGTGLFRQQDVGIGRRGGLGDLAVDHAHARGRALLRPPYELEIIRWRPFEGRRGVPFDDEGDVEALVHPDDIVYFHLDRPLCPCEHRHDQSRQRCCQSFHITTNSFLSAAT